MNAIVAANADWGIGCGGTQSIVIPEDRQHFKNITNGGVVIAGRKTFEDFGRPLPNRRNIVLTRSESFSAQGIIAVRSLPQLMAAIDGDDPAGVFVIGGESIYRALLPMCEYAYVTKIDAAPPSDTFFPNLDEMPEWEIAEQGPLLECRFEDKSVMSKEEIGVRNERGLERLEQSERLGIVQYSFMLYRKIELTPDPSKPTQKMRT